MNHTELIRLMHEVLDGAATAEEARELQNLLANDPAGRAEFEDLRRLFGGLNTMPKAHPPEGLVASVIARLPPATTRSAWLSQLSSRLGVFGSSSIRVRGSSTQQSPRTQRVSRFGSSMRSDNMSAQKNNLFRKPMVWLGAGIAAAAVVVAGYYNFPPQNTVGTIMPAQRFQATQPGASDVMSGGQTNAPQLNQTDSTIGASGDAGRISDDGRVNDGRVNDGRVNDGRVNDGRVNDGRVNDGRVNDGRVNDGRMNDGRVNDGRVNDGRVNDGRVNDGRVNDGRVNDGRVNDGRVNDGRVNDGRVNDNTN
jgi:hypothetical protein